VNQKIGEKSNSPCYLIFLPITY